VVQQWFRLALFFTNHNFFETFDNKHLSLFIQSPKTWSGTMARAIWKGAISFGLVHIPVSLVSATNSDKIDFDWLDKRTLDPVGYQRINKATGKPVNQEHIVKGIQYQKGEYVVLSEEEIKEALPESTQTIDIFSFVDQTQIPLKNFHKPYFLSPARRGEKVYALLRETLVSTNKVALAYVVIRTKQHLAAVMAEDSALVMLLLRWPAEVRGTASLDLSDAAVKPKLSAQEKDMAKRLVNDMSADWDDSSYTNTFNQNILDLVEEKAKAGKISSVREVDESAEVRKSADIVDLTELLKQSLSKKKTSSRSTTTKKTATRRKG